MAGYLGLLEGVWKGEAEAGVGALRANDGKVPDGVRYHVLDVWVDGLLETEGWGGAGLLRPVERLRTEGRTKVVRERAREVLEDERLQEVEGRTAAEGDREGDGEEEFEGFAERDSEDDNMS